MCGALKQRSRQNDCPGLVFTGYVEDKLWDRVTNICLGNLTTIGSDNGLSPGRRQAIIRTNDGILFIGPLGTNLSEISIEILTFSFKKMCLKVSSAKWQPFCLGLNELTSLVSPWLLRFCVVRASCLWRLMVRPTGFWWPVVGALRCFWSAMIRAFHFWWLVFQDLCFQWATSVCFFMFLVADGPCDRCTMLLVNTVVRTSCFRRRRCMVLLSDDPWLVPYVLNNQQSILHISHDDVIKWKHFPRYWPSVWGIHRSPVHSPHKGQWHGALMFSFICAWINGWLNNREAGDLRRHHAHYDVIVMLMTDGLGSSCCRWLVDHDICYWWLVFLASCFLWIMFYMFLMISVMLSMFHASGGLCFMFLETSVLRVTFFHGRWFVLHVLIADAVSFVFWWGVVHALSFPLPADLNQCLG